MATRITLAEAQSIPDILSAENYRLNLGEIPNIGNAADLSIKCQTAVIPGRRNESFEASLGGYVRNFSGRNLWERTIAIGFVEDITMGTSYLLRGWLEQIRGTNSGTAIGNIADYSVSPELSIFDQAGNEVDVVQFFNFYIESLSDINLEVNSSQPIQIQATFRYDYCIFANTIIR
jgi:hypothetical protein